MKRKSAPVGGGMSAFAKLSNLRSAGKKPSVEISVDAKASDGVDAAVNKKRAEKHDVQRIEKQNVQRAEKQLQERVEEQIQEQNEMKGQDSSSEDSMTTDSSISSSSSDEEFVDQPIPETQHSILSTTPLDKMNVVYTTKHSICLRLNVKMTLAILGQYDIWVKRGVISIMGAKLHPSSTLHRVYAPSTHPIPNIKCVFGTDGFSEVEISSCYNGPARLRTLNPIYRRITNSNTSASTGTPHHNGSFSFSILHTSTDDTFGRPLKAYNLDKKWSEGIQALGQRGPHLRVLTCGPKSAGKSTFNRFLLNHLLSPLPFPDSNLFKTDGVAFLDLDPGQPEFSPIGRIYLAHLGKPVFGPPFSHPDAGNDENAYIVRSHCIGANTPKDDPDYYVMATRNLMDHYRMLFQRYPQCPLIINYPGWIFGLGLEIASLFIDTLGLSDVAYMSENGPAEVINPLTFAAQEARVDITVLPSQCTKYAPRSKPQIRTMQMMSYFHSSQAPQRSRVWNDAPLTRTQPLSVSYTGPARGIFGIMVTGPRHDPDFLEEVLEGSVVGIVVIDSIDAIPVTNPTQVQFSNVRGSSPNATTREEGKDPSIENDGDQCSDTEHPNITSSPNNNLPYLFSGDGDCMQLNPALSNCLGLAFVRGVNTKSRTLELYTPVQLPAIRNAIDQGGKIVLVRGQIDTPHWALSEEYFAARSAQVEHRALVAELKANPKVYDTLDDELKRILNDGPAFLGERVHRASKVPWMRSVNAKAIDDNDDIFRGKFRSGTFGPQKNVYASGDMSDSEE